MADNHPSFTPILGSGIVREPERRLTMPPPPPKPSRTEVIQAGRAGTTLSRTIELPDPAPAVGARVRPMRFEPPEAA
jgi:hypothetical protein